MKTGQGYTHKEDKRETPVKWRGVNESLGASTVCDGPADYYSFGDHTEKCNQQLKRNTLDLPELLPVSKETSMDDNVSIEP